MIHNSQILIVVVLLMFLGVTLCEEREVVSRDFVCDYLEEVGRKPISQYDDIFKEKVVELGWDWRMLAAIIWNESRFNVNAVSSQGTRGLMQFMPRTAERFGLIGEDVVEPRKSVEAGVEYLLFLERRFDEIEDRDERIKFVLAAYNAGPGHVRDAMALAGKYGDNPYVWDDSVEKWLLLLQERKYYTDEVCKHGFFRGRYTVRYVKGVFKKYYEYTNS